MLLALDTAIGGQKPSAGDFYQDAGKIAVELKFEDIGTADIDRLAEEHRSKIKLLVHEGVIALEFTADVGERPKLNALQYFPNDDLLRNASETVKGMKAADLKGYIQTDMAAYADRLTEIRNLTEFRSRIEDIVAELPMEDKLAEYAPLTSGIPSSISSLLPEVIYIPAVKDLSEETRTKESAAFGKLMKAILTQIEKSQEFVRFQEAFADLNHLLNRDASTGEDKRIKELAWIENTLQNYLGEHFAEAQVTIRVGSPELKQVLSNAQIFVNDGVETPIEQKGDGIKRAMLFSLIRTYVDLQRKIKNEDESTATNVEIRPYLFLFEEPEWEQFRFVPADLAPIS